EWFEASRWARSRTMPGPDTSRRPSRKIQRSDFARSSALFGGSAAASIEAASLEICVEPAIHRKPSALISYYTHRPALGQLVFPLNDFALRLGDVGRKGKCKVL